MKKKYCMHKICIFLKKVTLLNESKPLIFKNSEVYLDNGSVFNF